MPRMAVVGRSGNSALAKVLAKGAMVQEFFQIKNSVRRDLCKIDYGTMPDPYYLVDSAGSLAV